MRIAETMKTKELSVIIVNYNTSYYLRNCLKSIYQNTKKISYEILVVDNKSSDDSIEMIKKEFPKVKLIINHTNAGFAKANNQAIRQAKGEYILLLNPDTVVLQDSLDNMIQFMQKNNVSLAAPKLLNADKSLQYSLGRYPTLISLLSELLLFHKISKCNYFNEIICGTEEYNKVHADADWVSGAALFAKKEVFDNIGLLDERFFMYSEEVDFCCRARNSGYKIYFYPFSIIIHLFGKSTRHKINWQLYKSRILLYKKYHSDLACLIYSMLCLIGYVERLPKNFL